MHEVAMKGEDVIIKNKSYFIQNFLLKQLSPFPCYGSSLKQHVRENSDILDCGATCSYVTSRKDNGYL